MMIEVKKDQIWMSNNKSDKSKYICDGWSKGSGNLGSSGWGFWIEEYDGSINSMVIMSSGYLFKEFYLKSD